MNKNAAPVGAAQIVKKGLFYRKIAQAQDIKRGNPRRGFPLENSPPNCFLTPSCVFGRRKGSALCGEWPTGLCPFGFPVTFYKRWTKILRRGAASTILQRFPREQIYAIFLPAGFIDTPYCSRRSGRLIFSSAGLHPNSGKRQTPATANRGFAEFPPAGHF